MSWSAVRPENIIKRAAELLAVGSKSEALATLHDFVNSKRFRTWQPINEEIMLKHIDLSVALRRSKTLSDAMWQYKTATQQVNLPSLEYIIKHLLDAAEAIAKPKTAATTPATPSAAVSPSTTPKPDDEEEVGETLEDQEEMEMNMSSTVKAAERTTLKPAQRFLWESYKTVMEITKNNPKLVALYHETARKTMAWCVSQGRKNEFRRLCDIVAQHLATARRNADSYTEQGQALPAHLVDLNSADVLQAMLDTRFIQYNSAAELEMWAVAYSSMSAVWMLMAKSTRPPKPAMLISYYQKLANLFWVAENPLIHAYALHAHYTLLKVAGTNLVSEEELRALASAVVLAALSAPVQATRTEDMFDPDAQRDKNKQLAKELNFPANPNRAALLREVCKDALPQAHPQAKELVSILESGFHPLSLCSRVAAQLEALATVSPMQLSRYARPLRELSVLRLLQQCGQVYDVIKIAEFTKMASFMRFEEVERLILQLTHRRLVTLTIDHVGGLLVFSRGGTTKADSLRAGLSALMKCLSSVIPVAGRTVAVAATQQKPANVMELIEKERVALLERHEQTEKKKERRELFQQILRRKEEEALAKRKPQQTASAAAAAPVVQSARAAPTIVLAKPTESQTEQQSAATLLSEKQRDDALKAQAQLDKRIANITRDADHLERAKRKKEQELLVAAYEQTRTKEREAYEKHSEVTLETAKRTHEQQTLQKAALAKMEADRHAYKEMVMAARRAVYEKAKAEYDVLVAEQKKKEEEEAKRKEEERRKAEEERLLKEKREKEEREAREMEEAARRQKEEEERELAQAAARAEREKREAQLRALEEAERRKQTSTTGKYVPPARSAPGGAAPEPAYRDERDRYGYDAPRDSGKYPPSSRYEPPRAGDRDRFEPPRSSGYSDRDRFEPPRAGDRDRFEAPRTGDRDRYEPPRAGDRDRFEAPRTGDRDRFEAPRAGDRDRYEPPRAGDRDRFEAPRAGDRDRYSGSDAPSWRRPADEGGYRAPSSSSNSYAPPQQRSSSAYQPPSSRAPPTNQDDGFTVVHNKKR